MLVLTRKEADAVDLALPNGEHALIRVVSIRGDKVRLGIVAPTEVGITRTDWEGASQCVNQQATAPAAGCTVPG